MSDAFDSEPPTKPDAPRPKRASRNSTLLFQFGLLVTIPWIVIFLILKSCQPQ